MTSPGEPPLLTQAQKRTILAGSIFVFVIGSTLAGFGVWFTRAQYLRLNTYLPVAATVDAVDVESTRDQQQGVVVERPTVRYHFSVAGSSYTSDRVTPFTESRTGSWARKIAARYRATQAVTAYYNPARPADAYLERKVRLTPFAFIAFPLGFMSVWALALLSTARQQRPFNAALDKAHFLQVPERSVS